MSIMLPSVLAPAVNSSAERRIFDWFRDAPGTEDWVILHSLGIATHNKVLYGETDFFAIVPGAGVFALEVKGGRVRRENGIWYFTDKYGKTNSKARGPFDQARDGIFSIISAVKQRLDPEHDYLQKIFYGFGVMFPDIEYSASGIDEEQWQVFDARDGRSVSEYIHRIASSARKKWEALYGNSDSLVFPSVADTRYLATILRGDFDLAISVSAQIRNAEDALISLTKEQYRCLDQLDDNPRCLIQGAAGTGKTLLAVEAAKKATACGRKTALLCYNSNLADWMDWYFARMPEEVRPSFAGSFHSFMSRLVKGHISLPFPKHTSELQQYYEESLPKAALKVLQSPEAEQFDCIIVDEAQDIINDLYLDIIDACLRRGVSRGNWMMFGDFSMQAIYSKGLKAQEMIGMLEDRTSFIRFKLTINCRNTKQICEEIQTITGFVPPSSLWTKTEGPPVFFHTWGDREDECTKLSTLLNELHSMGIENSGITILSPVKRENSVVAMMQSPEIKDFNVRNQSAVSYCTIQAFKGLENTVIILTDIENFDDEKLMYVGLSRARSGLYILESEQAKNAYNSLLLRRVLHER